MTPARFILCIENFDDPQRRVWAVRTKRKWYRFAYVDITVPVATVFKGKDAKQPKAYLEGVGVVRAWMSTPGGATISKA